MSDLATLKIHFAYAAATLSDSVGSNVITLLAVLDDSPAYVWTVIKLSVMCMT